MIIWPFSKKTCLYRKKLKFCHFRLSISEDMDPVDKDCKLKLARYRRRLQMMLRALYNICGDAMRKALITQQSLLQVDKNGQN